MRLYSKLSNKWARYTAGPKAVNENWSRRMPLKYMVGYSTDHAPLTRLLLNYTFRDAQIVKDLRNESTPENLRENLGNLIVNLQDKSFIEGFPYESNIGHLYEQQADGVNLFIDFKIKEGQQELTEKVGINTKTGRFFPAKTKEQDFQSIGKC